MATLPPSTTRTPTLSPGAGGVAVEGLFRVPGDAVEVKILFPSVHNEVSRLCLWVRTRACDTSWP